MARKAKCQFCLEFDEVSNLVKNKKGKYFHKGECHDLYLEQRKIIEQDNAEWDELYQYVKELHGYPDGINLPSLPIMRLKALRDGYDIIGGKREKKNWKQGATFSLMLSAYKLKENDIKWFIHNVLKDQCDAASISKCITLMTKALGEAWRLDSRKEEARGGTRKSKYRKQKKTMFPLPKVIIKIKKMNWI